MRRRSQASSSSSPIRAAASSRLAQASIRRGWRVARRKAQTERETHRDKHRNKRGIGMHEDVRVFLSRGLGPGVGYRLARDGPAGKEASYSYYEPKQQRRPPR